MREGWSAPKPDVTPRPTSWPVGLAFGVALFGWGFISSPVVLGVGGIVFVTCLAGWIREMRHDR